MLLALVTPLLTGSYLKVKEFTLDNRAKAQKEREKMKNCNERITEELERVAHTFRRYMENPTVESWRVLRGERWVNVEGTVRPYQKRIQQWEHYTFDEGETPEELTKALTDSPDSVEWLEDFDLYEDGDGEQPPFCEHGLSLDWQEGDDGEEGFLCYLLSWGGPSDELRFYRDGTVEYWFKDWFDGASRDVSREDWAQWLLDTWKDFGFFYEQPPYTV